jgi:hypothetical protein
MRIFVNLLPFEYRKGEVLRRRLLQWSLVWTLCLVTAIGVWWLKQNRYRASFHAADAAQRRYLPVERLVEESEKTRIELKGLRAKGTLWGQLRDERPLLTLIGLVSRSARQCNGRLDLHRLLFERQEEHPKTDDRRRDRGNQQPQQPAEEETRPWAVVTLEGEARDNLAVATFVVALRDTGVFRRVELKSSTGKDSVKPGVRSYLLKCEI